MHARKSVYWTKYDDVCELESESRRKHRKFQELACQINILGHDHSY